MALLILVGAPPGPLGAQSWTLEQMRLVSDDLRAFNKWTDMLRRFRRELDGAAPSADCAHGPRDGVCEALSWFATIEAIKGLPTREMLDVVNRKVNAYPYRSDRDNWGLEDFWATPFEFFRRGGDCEDYAIAKMLTLELAGVHPSLMRLIVLNDLNLRRPHAVLAVVDQGELLILDNQIRQVVPARRIRHYRPIYALNADGWWLPRP